MRGVMEMGKNKKRKNMERQKDRGKRRRRGMDNSPDQGRSSYLYDD